MKKIDFTLDCMIDGRPHDPGLIGHHAQWDPFPGDHRYRVIIQGQGVAKALSSFTSLTTPGDYSNLDSGICNWVFWELERFLRRDSEIGQGRYADYLLNTISRLSVSAEGVEIEGVCSTVLFNDSDVKEVSSEEGASDEGGFSAAP